MLNMVETDYSDTNKAIPTGELIRASRNCSFSLHFDQESRAIYNHLTQIHYPKWMLRRASKRISNISRDQLLVSKMNIPHDNQINPGVFSTSYCAEFYDVSRIIEKYLPVVHSDPEGIK